MVSIEGGTMRGVTWCVAEDVESGGWGIGGKALLTADVHALARGKRPDGAISSAPFCARSRDCGSGVPFPGGWASHGSPKPEGFRLPVTEITNRTPARSDQWMSRHDADASRDLNSTSHLSRFKEIVHGYL
jgi:hypothetical protein